MAQIGLLGGAFDPPHNGHLAVARAVLAARGLDRVDLLVSGQSPHRGGKITVAPAADRAAMAHLAAQDEIGIGVEECELARSGPSYTIDTIRWLRRERPQNRYCVIVGADMALDLPNWREAGELLDLVEIVPVLRPGFDTSLFERLVPALGKAHVARLRAAHVDVPQLAVSSTAVRNAVAAGESIEAMVPAAVARYIYARRLYR
ncbi:MAG: nicotinate (nicotinamide) nucleotide adenylyltransferase [Planctomycetes bacterium]|jgi:nicotinate-nucleotide adenylyltransferase|nr:nicotinate (nicotinamide) nucleotide adenylyltransferase [Planctomycetota bacterium]MCL4731757.1 nicotinate-nucleotide adenylyltransferase [Planctomycetota bacterium]